MRSTVLGALAVGEFVAVYAACLTVAWVMSRRSLSRHPDVFLGDGTGPTASITPGWGIAGALLPWILLAAFSGQVAAFNAWLIP